MQVALLILAVLGGLLVAARKRTRFRPRDRLRPQPAPDWRPADPPPAPNPVEMFAHERAGQAAPTCEAILEAQKATFRRMLERGDLERAASSIRPGPDYGLQLRALAEIGSEDAGRLIESQLARPIGVTPDELGWYRADLARCLRDLERDDCLPVLLRNSGEILDRNTGAVFAGELVRFDSFGESLRDSDGSVSGPARRALRQALAGIRSRQLPLSLVADARLGDLLGELTDWFEENRHYDVVGVLLEGLRLLRRADHAERFLGGCPVSQESLHWQYSCLAEAEPAIVDGLRDAVDELAGCAPELGNPALGEWLDAVDDLRVDTGDLLWPSWIAAADAYPAKAIDCLRWAKTEGVVVALVKRLRFTSGVHGHAETPRLLTALRHHPSPEGERELIRLAQTGAGAVRSAALSSLGWWDPMYHHEAVAVLRDACARESGEAFMRATCALARMGDLSALDRLRRWLKAGGSPGAAPLVLELVREGVNWLWPEIDELVDSEDLDVAFAACEALECAREEQFGPLH